MKIFIVVLIAAIVIGGFVGAEIMGTNFSITGAVIGGIGTFSVLMGLGAIFDAQEQRKKKKEQPKEVRELFDSMLGNISTQPRRTSKPQPFHKNTNDAERKEWFSRTTPWHKVDPSIIDELIKIFGNNSMNSMFEVFVAASMENDLVKEYAELPTKGVSSEVVHSFIASVLYSHGVNASAQVGDMVKAGNINNKKIAKVYINALNLLESTINVDENYVDAYVNLAALKGMFNAAADALVYVQKGLIVGRSAQRYVKYHRI